MIFLEFDSFFLFKLKTKIPKKNTTITKRTPFSAMGTKKELTKQGGH